MKITFIVSFYFISFVLFGHFWQSPPQLTTIYFSGDHVRGDSQIVLNITIEIRHFLRNFQNFNFIKNYLL